MTLGEQIGRRIREARDEKKLTLFALSQRCGIDPGYLSKLERGEIDSPGIETISKIFPVLGLSVDEFMPVPASAGQA